MQAWSPLSHYGHAVGRNPGIQNLMYADSISHPAPYISEMSSVKAIGAAVVRLGSGYPQWHLTCEGLAERPLLHKRFCAVPALPAFESGFLPHFARRDACRCQDEF